MMKLSSLYKHCLIVLPFFQALVDVWTGIKNDALIILADPALDWKIEILFAYPGFWALFWFRISHVLFVWRFPLLPRIIMGVVRLLTAVDIHPGAKISKGGVFIDHGAGVVIGATAEIGAGTIVYHQVTLGASGRPVPKGERRHPAVGKGCVLGAGTKLIGAINIGDGVITGANSVVTKSVEPFCTAVGVPARSRPQATVTTATRLVPEPENMKEVQMPTTRPESPNMTRLTHKRLSCPLEVQGAAHVCSKKCNSEICPGTENHIQANLDVPLQ